MTAAKHFTGVINFSRNPNPNGPSGCSQPDGFHSAVSVLVARLRMLAAGLVACLPLATSLTALAEPQVQQIPLNRGWNLISIQVGPETGFAPAEIERNIANEKGEPVQALVSAWNAYPLGGSNVWATFQAAIPAAQLGLDAVRPGRGYWVQVNQPSFLRLTNEPWNGSVSLQPGWNLVGFPGLRVESSGLSLESVFRSQLTNIQQVWTFDNSPSGQRYRGYDVSGRQPLKELTTLEPGRAYWVYSQAAGNLELASVPSVALLPDVDNPPLAEGGSSMFLAGDLVNIQDLAATLKHPSRTFDTWLAEQLSAETRAALASYQGPTSDLTLFHDLVMQDLNRMLPKNSIYDSGRFSGITLRSKTETLRLQNPQGSDLQRLNRLLIEDAYPLEVSKIPQGSVKRPGPEDADSDLNGNGILDDAFTQDTLVFPIGIDSRLVTVRNEGFGRLNWQATAKEGLGQFIRFAVAEAKVSTAGMSPDLISAQAGRIERFGTNVVRGSVASEPAYIKVEVDRAGLVPGTYTNEFEIEAGGQRKIVRVRMEMPQIDGDWSGYAAIRRVNGKEISLGKVDLYLGLFRPSGAVSGGVTQLRAIINRERSLLFPRDVALSGSFYGEHQFTLNANFEVPRGDRNAPPFATFKTGKDDATGGVGFGDFDFNNDGRLDNSNPFPFALRREVSLQGVRLSGSRLVGQYVESIQNLLPGDEKIYLEGEFELERKGFLPTLTGIFNQTQTTNVVIGGGASFQYSTELSITNQFVVEGASGDFNLDFAGGRDVTVRLTSPAGTNAVVLATQANGFRGSQSFSTSAFNGQGALGRWTISVEWVGGSERGQFQAWSLRLQGTTTYDIEGTVVLPSGESASRVPGALVRLTGHGAVAERVTGADGRFAFTNLTENDYTVFVSKPGYAEVKTEVNLFTSSVVLKPTVLVPLTNEVSVLQVAPWLGAEPLRVQLTALLSSADSARIGTVTGWSWAYGDGQQQDFSAGNGPSVSHAYLAGYFRPVVTVTGANGIVQMTNEVHVLANHSGTNRVNFSRIAFIGSGPESAVAAVGRAFTAQIIQQGVTNTYTVLSMSNPGESDRYMGTTNSSGVRFIPTLGGSVFGMFPAEVGYPPGPDPARPSTLRFSVGRIQP